MQLVRTEQILHIGLLNKASENLFEELIVVLIFKAHLEKIYVHDMIDSVINESFHHVVLNKFKLIVLLIKSL